MVVTYMAMKQPDTRVVSRESEHQETRGGKHSNISTRRVGEVQLVDTSISGSSLLAKDVKVVTVEMDRVSLR